MKKFKVIEESRFLNKEGMSGIRGGTVCTPDNPYSSPGCGSMIYTTCTGGVAQFVSTPCVNMHTTCSEGMNYTQTSCWNMGLFSTNCSSENPYTS